MPNRWGFPDLGIGVGLRTVHFGHILSQHPPVDWFEVLSENFMRTGGRPLYVLDQVAERYPVALHGVSLSIGSTDPLNREHIQNLKDLAARTRAHWISDHLCWTGVLGRNTHDAILHGAIEPKDPELSEPGGECGFGDLAEPESGRDLHVEILLIV